MSEATLEAVLTTDTDQQEQFDKIIKYLNYLSHEIDDIGAVAARLINERRAKYTFHFKQNEAFLREYAMEHLKRGADGEIKGKNYKSLTAGGGVFFRGTPEKISIDDNYLMVLYDVIKNTKGVDTAESLIVEKKVMHEVTNKKQLVETLREIIKERAEGQLNELRETVEMTEEQAEEALNGFIEQGELEVFRVGNIIEITEADPFASISVGTTVGWSPKSVKEQITKALEGKIMENEDDVLEAFIEDVK